MSDTIFSQYKGGRRGPWVHREFQMTTSAGKQVPHGLLQYKVTDEELKTFDQPEDVVNDPPDWIIGEISTENLERLTPQTKTGTANPWELVAVIKKCNHTGEIIAIKGALKNVVRPNEYALMTAFHPTEADQYNFRKLKDPSKGGWIITFSRMIAPYIFWNALKIAVDSVETTDIEHDIICSEQPSCDEGV